MIFCYCTECPHKRVLTWLFFLLVRTDNWLNKDLCVLSYNLLKKQINLSKSVAIFKLLRNCIKKCFHVTMATFYAEQNGLMQSF